MESPRYKVTQHVSRLCLGITWKQTLLRKLVTNRFPTTPGTLCTVPLRFSYERRGDGRHKLMVTLMSLGWQ